MAIDFTAARFERTDYPPPGTEVVVPVAGVEPVNFHSAGGASVLARLGLPGCAWGESELGTFDRLTQAALQQCSDETDPDTRRLTQLRQLVNQAWSAGATHVAWS